VAGGLGKLFLVTDVLDARVLPAEVGVAAHASRWRLEDCFETLDLLPAGGAEVILRSKDPDLIRQEVHAILCCYQAVRILADRGSNGRAAPEVVPGTSAGADRRLTHDGGTESSRRPI
jgi:hypothetical protein